MLPQTVLIPVKYESDSVTTLECFCSNRTRNLIKIKEGISQRTFLCGLNLRSSSVDALKI